MDYLFISGVDIANALILCSTPYGHTIWKRHVDEQHITDASVAAINVASCLPEVILKVL